MSCFRLDWRGLVYANSLCGESLWVFGFEKGINGHLIMTNERSSEALMNGRHWYEFIFLTLVLNFQLK